MCRHNIMICTICYHNYTVKQSISKNCVLYTIQVRIKESKLIYTVSVCQCFVQSYAYRYIIEITLGSNMYNLVS